MRFRCMFFAMRRAAGPFEKYFDVAQAAFPMSPIAPLSPGASLCPSGNQGAAATCMNRVTDWLDRPAAGKFVDHSLGVTSLANGTSTLA